MCSAVLPSIGACIKVRSFEGPLEFYYPGQPDMTLVSGSVNVVRTSAEVCPGLPCGWALVRGD